MTNKWYVYMLHCCDGTFYTGITNNPEERFNMHEQGKGSKYVKGRLPFRVVYLERADGRSSALKREAEIKKYGKIRKLTLGTTPSSYDLLKELGVSFRHWDLNKKGIQGVKL